MMARVAILNQKGGVGKTTVTLGLVSAALSAGRSALVVDLDPQASAAWALGVDGPSGLVEALKGGGSGAASNSIVPSSWDPALQVISGGLGMQQWLPEGGPKTSARALGKVLKGVDDDHDVTFIDCPAGLGPITVNALAAADVALVVTESSAFANNTMAAVADVIDDVWDQVNPDLDLGGVIVNRQPAISSEAQSRFDELGRIVGKRSIWKPAIPQRVIVAEALGARRPIHSYGARSADVSNVFDAHYRKLERTLQKARS